MVAPITLLVKGDVTVGPSGRISVNGFPGGNATNGNAGTPGQPGPGGFAGGQGAYQVVNFATIGGNGSSGFFGDGKTSIRGGYGIAYDVLFYNLLTVNASSAIRLLGPAGSFRRAWLPAYLCADVVDAPDELIAPRCSPVRHQYSVPSTITVTRDVSRLIF